MGMRRNIKLEYSNSEPAELPTTNCIYLYTHWDAEGLEVTLAESLRRSKSRWDDESYLARIIFTDMTKSVGDELTGFGLAPYEMEDEFPTIVVDLKNMTVNDVPYDDFIERPEMFSAYSRRD